MKKYIIVTDSTTDLPDSYANESGIKIVPLGFSIDGKNYKDYLDKRELSTKDFYDKISLGKTAKTYQVNPKEFYDVFKEITDSGYGVLGIIFSSGLSGTFNSARFARDQILAENPGAEIVVIDSLCASLGEGLLVHYALKAQKEGMTLYEAQDYLENLKMKISHWFTVMDLDTLKRGGRVSAAAAFFAKTLNIHPVLHVSNEGKLVARMKKIGRKNALNTLAEKLFETYIPDENEVICISHSCCLEDVNKLKEAIIHKTGIKNIILNEIGPVIGGHCGIGTIALFFVSKER